MRSLADSLKRFIEEATGRKTGVSEFPKDANLPVFVVRPNPGPAMEGSMGQPNSIDFQVYQIDVVGKSTQSVEDAEFRLVSAMNNLHVSVANVMGPPTLRRNGTSREDDRTYRAMVIATIPVAEG